MQKRESELTEAFKGRDVNKTVAKVEAILAKNPTLPRLTRGEIIALFEDITRSDASKKKQQESPKSLPDRSEPEKEKSLMVVLPFNPSVNQTQGLEELYTRQPVTRIVGVESTTQTSTSTTTTARPKKKRKNGTRRKPTNQEIRPVYVDGTRTSTAVPSAQDVSWNPMVGSDEKSTVKKQNSYSGIDVPHYMQDTLDTFQNSNNQVFVTVSPQKSTIKQQSTVSPAESSTSLPNIAIAAQSLTPELKNLLVSLGLLNPDGSQVSMPLTTTTTTHLPPPLIQYISINPTVDPASYIVFKPLPGGSRGNVRGNNDDALSDDMRHFLASFGLTSDSESLRSQKALSAMDIKPSSGISTTTSTEVPLKSSEKKEEEVNKNDSMLPDINPDILTDDMKDVLENIGLMKKPKRKSKGAIFNPAMRAGVLSQPEEKEKVNKLLTTIKELSEAERNKSLSAEEIAEQLQNITATLAEENKEDEHELVEGESSEMSYEGYEPAEEELLKLQNGFVDDDLKDDFALDGAVGDISNNSNDLSLESLSDTLNVKDSGAKQSLKDTHNPPDPLSPEEINHFIENSKNEVKRQQPKKKRQQPSSTTTVESTQVSSTTESSPVLNSTSDQPKSNSDSSSDSTLSLTPVSSTDSVASDSAAAAASDSSSDLDDTSPSTDDLIDSFGGENPPENRPNGLYFLVDWNTFLRVGTDNKTVDLNFSPKVGDPKNFIPITVP